MPIDFQPLLDMVTDRPDTEHGVQNWPGCPFCGHKPITRHESVTTLMGSFVDLKKYPEQNPNHQYMQCSCEKCNNRCTMHCKYDNVWITVPFGSNHEQLVVQGLPSDGGGRYLYHCSKCKDGYVRHEYRNKSDNQRATGLSSWHNEETGQREISYYNHWYCDRCDSMMTSDNINHWYVGPPPLPPAEQEKQRKIADAIMNGHVTFGPGAVIGHTAGLARADFR